MKAIRAIFTCSVLSILLLTACSDKRKEQAAKEAKSDVKYTCPMHPQVLEDHPGSCPICGMTLVKKSGQASEGAGISLNTVLEPVNSTVISNVKSIAAESKKRPVEIEADGYLGYDTRTFNNIASRFSGRIEKLYVKYAFQEIHQGQRIMDIYSPNMVTAQQDLIFLVKNSPSETGLINAAKEKLLLLGMTEMQIGQIVKTGKSLYSLPVYSPYDGHVHDMPHSQMPGTADAQTQTDLTSNIPLAIKEGMYVDKGQILFNVVNPHMLWAVIKIDRAKIANLKLKQPVTLTLPDMPGKTYDGQVNFIEPTLQEGDKAISVRVYLQNMDHQLRVGSLVKAKIRTGEVSGLWIPRTALMDLGQTKVVWLKKGVAYHAHQVSTSVVSGDEIFISKGLLTTDSVATNAQYLTDSESFIKTQGNE